MTVSFQKLFFTIATVFALFAILVLAKTVLIPLVFALLAAFILLPVTKKFEDWGAGKIMSAFLSLFSLFLIIGGVIFLFSTQIIQLSENINEFQGKIIGVFADVTLFINKNIAFAPDLEQGELLEKLKTWANESTGTLVNQTFSSTASIITGLLSAIIFTFLILLYRKGLVNAFVHFYPKEERNKASEMLKSVQQVGQKYLSGMILIILILGFLNSIGLWIIGIDSPFLFGFFAAVLAIIPYVGTVFGAAVPILYSFMSDNAIWMPIAIAIFFWLIQFIESNFLTPKIVGGNLRVNALAAILSIIIGASIWGVAGMILFLPLTAMLKVVCDEYDELKPVALLIGNYNNTEGSRGDSSIKKITKKLKLN